MIPTLLALGLAAAAQATAPATATARAERLAAEALSLEASDPAAALERARRALATTAEFDPTAFVSAGRKGEIVEDEFQAAREGYARHRARLYETLGLLLARGREPLAGARYLARAQLLDPQPERALALARAQLALGRGREALDTIRRGVAGLVDLPPLAIELLGRAADAAGLPSAQTEIDRGRLRAALGEAVELRDGPLALDQYSRLSTHPVFRLADSPVNLIYVAEPSCRSCSADLAELRRLVPAEIRVLMLPAVDDRDVALRQVLDLYRYPWPLLLGKNLAGRLALKERQVLLVAREGWIGAVMKPPLGSSLATAVGALGRTDVSETRPRPAWNGRAVDRTPLPPPPGLLPEGLAPGEDVPPPEEFTRAVGAYRAGRWREAMELFDALAARGDGWLLPPEARLNRALCLAGLGQRDAARRMLLRIGDGRLPEAIDRALEAVAGRPGAGGVQ
jgi:tetratricopeptide (TPR) repeat protein